MVCGGGDGADAGASSTSSATGATGTSTSTATQNNEHAKAVFQSKEVKTILDDIKASLKALQLKAVRLSTCVH